MTDLTATAKKIMGLFHYFKIKQGDTMSLSLFLTRKHLWKETEEQEVQDALGELIQKDYIKQTDDPAGWMLREKGFQYLKKQ